MSYNLSFLNNTNIVPDWVSDLTREKKPFFAFENQNGYNYYNKFTDLNKYPLTKKSVFYRIVFILLEIYM